MKTYAIMGLGLMGGSLGLALRRRGVGDEVRGYARREETRREALAAAPLAERCLPGLEGSSLLTDVGSTKQEVAAQMDAVLSGAGGCFLGSHPIAGSEAAGLAAARPDLYDGAMVVVTPAHDGQAQATSALKAFWEALGCRVAVMSPSAHDSILARTSHLPHLVSAILVAAVGREAAREAGRFCGTGFRDASRLSGGSPALWHDIVQTNADALVRELNAFSGALEEVRAMIKQGDFDALQGFLAEMCERRNGMLAGPEAGARS